MTTSGSSAAIIGTKSPSPAATALSTISSQTPAIRSSSLPIVRGVNPRLTRLRCRVWSGGSMFSIIIRCCTFCSSGISNQRRRGRGKDLRLPRDGDDVLVAGHGPETGPAGLAALGVPEDRVVRAQPRELGVRRPVVLVTVRVDGGDCLPPRVSALRRPTFSRYGHSGREGTPGIDGLAVPRGQAAQYWDECAVPNCRPCRRPRHGVHRSRRGVHPPA